MGLHDIFPSSGWLWTGELNWVCSRWAYLVVIGSIQWMTQCFLRCGSQCGNIFCSTKNNISGRRTGFLPLLPPLSIPFPLWCTSSFTYLQCDRKCVFGLCPHLGSLGFPELQTQFLLFIHKESLWTNLSLCQRGDFQIIFRDCRIGTGASLRKDQGFFRELGLSALPSLLLRGEGASSQVQSRMNSNFSPCFWNETHLRSPKSQGLWKHWLLLKSWGGGGGLGKTGAHGLL